jgi:hypothetical protein
MIFLVKKTTNTWTVKLVDKLPKGVELGDTWFGGQKMNKCYVETEFYNPSRALALGEYYIDR